MTTEEESDLKKYRFRDLHPNISIGMASDRYAGWIGQVYSEGRYSKEIKHRTHKIGEKTFTEEVLPVESVEEYFEHFPILEIDFTFYRLLLDKNGKPTPNYFTLKEYQQHLKKDDQLILKVPQLIFARRIRQGGKFVENEAYLNSQIFTHQFYKPAVEILSSNLRGFMFEQEYHPKKERVEPDEMAKALDAFFNAIPKDKRYHVELRTEAYLAEPVFDVLEKHGVGLVYSHWTWLPPLSKQFSKTKGRFFNSGGDCIIRLMTPRRMSYEDSYTKAFPFNENVEGMMNPEMIDDAVEIIMKGVRQNKRMRLIINNRAGGNGPIIAQEIAEELQKGKF
ncbi:MAG: DUF72 domain-containing protein [Deltaproteobacteria bacterium]|nr:DUF72 domain-containing protein [Deltaproteobacteria bacterium]